MNGHPTRSQHLEYVQVELTRPRYVLKKEAREHHVELSDRRVKRCTEVGLYSSISLRGLRQLPVVDVYQHAGRTSRGKTVDAQERIRTPTQVSNSWCLELFRRPLHQGREARPCLLRKTSFDYCVHSSFTQQVIRTEVGSIAYNPSGRVLRLFV